MNKPTNTPPLDPLRAAPASVRLSDAEQIDYLIMDAVETRLAKGEPISDMARFKAGCRKAILENEKQYRGYTWKLFTGTKKRREPQGPRTPLSEAVWIHNAIDCAASRWIRTRDVDDAVAVALDFLPWNLRSPDIEERIRKELAA